MVLTICRRVRGTLDGEWQVTGGRKQSPTSHFPLVMTLSLMLSVFTFSACTTDRTLSERPPRLLSHQEMVSFLIDLHLAESKMNYIEIGKTDSLEMIFRNYEKHLMQQHGFTDSVYLQSYRYYLDHMELMNEIYSDVVDSLSVINSRKKAENLETIEDIP